jgi:hypothetical protein
MSRYLLGATLCLLCSGAALSSGETAGGTPAPAETTVPANLGHPLARAAHVLKRAIEVLEKAEHDFGGHREAALQACRQAEKQLWDAHDFERQHENGGKKVTAPAVQPPVTTSVPSKEGQKEERGEHPRLARAVEEIDKAIAYLQNAPHDFGGHRVDAIKDCETAKTQLQEALAYAGKHEKR